MTDKRGVIPFRSTSDLGMEAAQWLAKLDRGALTQDERAALVQWLREDPRRKDAIKNAAVMWYGINPAFGAPFVAESDECAVDGRVKARRRASGDPFARLAAVLTSIAAVVAAGVFFMTSNSRAPGADAAYYSTAFGETRMITLADGSSIHLNTDSIVEAAYANKERGVRLIRGEAVFDVSHSDKRPFRVFAEDGVIRAVGTKFAVRITPKDVIVTVTDGKVALTERAAAGEASPAQVSVTGEGRETLFVQRGETANIDDVSKNLKRPVSDGELEQRLAWTEGKLIFKDEALDFVISEITRYAPVEIRIEDETLKAQKITGILPIGDVELMLEGIEASLGVDATHISEGVVLLSRI